MTGKRRNRATKTTTARSSAPAAPKKAAPEATHLATADGDLHDNVTVFEPSHGPNTDDRMDIVADEPKPMKETAVPATRRIDEGQNRGAE